jgi:hypothetical protein
MASYSNKVLGITGYLFKSKLKTILIFCLIIFVINWLTIMPFKSTANLDLAGLMNSLPQAYRTLFGDFNLINTPAGYLGLKNFSMAYPLIQGILAISLAASFLGRNRSNGFNSYLLAKGLSRAKLFVAINLAILAVMIAVNLFNFLSIIFFSFLFDFNINLWHLHLAFVGLNLMSFIFAAITGLVTNFASREVGIGMGYYLFFQSYMANSLSTISKDLESAKYLSLFHYNKYDDLLFGRVSLANFMILGLIFVTVSFGSWLVFKYHDY